MTSHLIEPSMKNFLNHSLKRTHAIKMTYYNYYFNTMLFLGFVVVFGGWMYYMYKGKMSPLEKRQKHERERRFIMQKIRTLQIEKEKKLNKNRMITELPTWEGPYRQ